MKLPHLLMGLAAAVVMASPAQAALEGKIPEPGMVTFVSFGSDGCRPCRMMEPHLRKLDKEFEGRAAIRELNLSKYPEVGPYFRITAVPTQILFDSKGQELGWHQGYMDEVSMRTAIEDALKKDAENKKATKVADKVTTEAKPAK